MDEPLKSITGALSAIMRRSMNFRILERLCAAGRTRSDPPGSNYGGLRGAVAGPERRK